jgi:hypothetical protein
MEKLEITTKTERKITSEELAEFMKQFNLLRSDSVKRRIISLVKSLDKVEPYN